jgi:hypothetical protein
VHYVTPWLSACTKPVIKENTERVSFAQQSVNQQPELSLVFLVKGVLAFEWLSELFYILRRVHAKQLIELFTEKFSIINAHFKSDFIHIAVRIDKQFSSFPQPDKPDKSSQ